MTDNEIIKALECCINQGFQECKICPLYIQGEPCEKTKLPTIALDLINRQKAEIERYREVVGELAVAEDGTVTGLLNGKETKFIDKEVAETFKRFAVSGARNEFAERAVKRICETVTAPLPTEKYIVAKCIETIENLLEEMEGLE